VRPTVCLDGVGMSEISTTLGNRTPILRSWSVNWQTEEHEDSWSAEQRSEYECRRNLKKDLVHPQSLLLKNKYGRHLILRFT
jgi:hypothetical protein